jgi:hypothetical protein
VKLTLPLDVTGGPVYAAGMEDVDDAEVEELEAEELEEDETVDDSEETGGTELKVLDELLETEGLLLTVFETVPFMI